MKPRPTESRPKPWLLLLSLLAAFSLIAAACGGGDDADADADADASAETDDDVMEDDAAEDDAAEDDAMEDEDAMEDDGDAEASGDGVTLNIATVNNAQMEDIARLTPELFTAETGIEVNYTTLQEQNLRELVTRGLGGGNNEFDVVMIGMYEAPQFGANGWLRDLNTFAADDPDWKGDDIIPAVRNGLSVGDSLYAAPFYAESSFLMFRQDRMDEAGITVPEAPTWQEVADIAREIDGDDAAGICLRGLPGWGDLGASFTTVLNTFGGTYWSAGEGDTIGESQVDQPEFKEALDFYVSLIQDAGQDDAATFSFNQCRDLYLSGGVSMWYDATSAAPLIEADDSPVKGLNGYALAPTVETDTSGWLWAWALAIPEATVDEKVDAAWEYVSWATSQEYIETAAEELGWVSVPPGTRNFLYEAPEYQEAAAAFADRTLDAMLAAPIDNPGTTPRPGVPGVQYVGVPQFQDFGTRCTQEIGAAIAGNQSTDDAQAKCHAIAQEFEGEPTSAQDG